MELELDEIKQVLNLIAELDCAEVELTVGDVHLQVRRASAVRASGPAEVAPPPPATAQPTPIEAPIVAPGTAPESPSPSRSQEWESAEADGTVVIVRSPMVGSVYAAKEPGAAPFVSIGDSVKESETVCIVEVMKLFNSLESPITGEVVDVLFDDGDTVQFGQPLVVIRG